MCMTIWFYQLLTIEPIKKTSSLRSKLGILRKRYGGGQGKINLTRIGYKNYLVHFDKGIGYTGAGSLDQD